MTGDATLGGEQLEIERALKEPQKRHAGNREGAGEDHDTLVGPGMPEEVGQREKRGDDGELADLHAHVETDQAQQQ